MRPRLSRELRVRSWKATRARRGLCPAFAKGQRSRTRVMAEQSCRKIPNARKAWSLSQAQEKTRVPHEKRKSPRPGGLIPGSCRSTARSSLYVMAEDIGPRSVLSSPRLRSFGIASRRRLGRSSVLLELGSTNARHEPAIGATFLTQLVGLRRSLVRVSAGTASFAGIGMMPLQPHQGVVRSLTAFGRPLCLGDPNHRALRGMGY